MKSLAGSGWKLKLVLLVLTLNSLEVFLGDKIREYYRGLIRGKLWFQFLIRLRRGNACETHVRK